VTTPRTVLHLIDTTGPGGAETVYLSLVLGLDPARFRSVATCDVPSPGAIRGQGISAQGWLHDALTERGIDPVVLRTTRAFDLAYLARIVRLVRSSRAELIHAHLLTSNLYGSIAGLLTGVPVVATFHGSVDIPAHRLPTAVKIGIINRGARRIVFVSEHLRREMLAGTGLRAARSVVVHNGVDCDHFQPARNDRLRRELGIGADVLLVGAVGNVREAKGYNVLLDSAALLASSGPPVRIVIAGEDTGQPALMEALLRRRAHLGLDEAVRFLGFKHDAAEFLNGLDIFVLPSLMEGFSLSTVEAMACSVPVVATRSGGPEEIVSDGDSGLLVAAGDAHALAAALARLRDDGALRRSLAVRARAHAVRDFSMGSMVRGYEAVYDAVS
jgi:glycosyltransferase involved in cell wall biosynthesis